jgi:hypothetical protein
MALKQFTDGCGRFNADLKGVGVSADLVDERRPDSHDADQKVEKPTAFFVECHAGKFTVTWSANAWLLQGL